MFEIFMFEMLEPMWAWTAVQLLFWPGRTLYGRRPGRTAWTGPGRLTLLPWTNIPNEFFFFYVFFNFFYFMLEQLT